MGTEKRKFTRVEFETNAIINFKEKEYLVKLDNLSLKGCFTKMKQDLIEDFDSGDVVTMILKIDGITSELNMNIEAIAIRVGGSDGIGWEFKSLELDTFIYLRDIIGFNSGDTEKITQEFVEYVEDSIDRNK